ncbi:hypothetical protein Micbo1qcDRAFT_209995 [Microdochium bolleyi]|uniref:Uncharacterized protein n=1 Tax=Microdochium bolleyi TaxID=196109 RepID=A0A136IKE7_9PEZI|nr:hypothetical protein Micbo1qcDRAFT_209995 [Microdochium bolleyi]
MLFHIPFAIATAWRTFRSYVPNLLRPIGLRIFASTKDEARKAVVFDSFVVAGCRSLIHLVPAAVSVSLVVLNLQRRFVGRELQGESGKDEIKQNAIQIAAKIQELFVMSSIGSMILHLIRHRMIYGVGIPFGLLGSDKAIAQPSFFWSIDFVGGVKAYLKRSNLIGGILFGALLVFGGISALFVGPATAILMLPREMEWPVGGGILTLNKTEAQLWPTLFNAIDELESFCKTSDHRLNRRWCPSSGFVSLDRTFSRHWHVHRDYQQFRVDDGYLMKTIHAEAGDSGGYDTWAYTTHGPVAGGQDIVIDHHDASLDLLRARQPYASPSVSARYLDLAKSKEYRVETRLPLARTLCRLQPTMTVHNATTRYAFPRIERFGWWRDQGALRATGDDDGPLEYLDVFEDVRDNLLLRNTTIQSPADIPAAIKTLDHIVIPVALPRHLNGTIGLVVYRNNSDDRSLDGLVPIDVNVCLVDARWVDGLSIQRFDSFTDLHQRHDSGLDRTANNVQAMLPGVTGKGLILTRMDDIAKIDQGQIRMSRRWFNFISPFVTDDDLPKLQRSANLPNRTTLERLVHSKRMPTYINGTWSNALRQWRAEPEVVISAFFVDSLSRSGEDTRDTNRRVRAALPGGGPEPATLAGQLERASQFVRYGAPRARLAYIEQAVAPQNQSLVEISMQAVFTGYVMSPTNEFDIFCMALLLAHAVLALLHTVLCLTRFRSQIHETWDSMPQLVALAQQSPPASATVLDNTSGGIGSLKTAARIATIEVSHSGEEGPEELQLRVRGGFRRGVARGYELNRGRQYGLKTVSTP